MNSQDFVPGKLPVALMALIVMFAVAAVLLLWSASHRKEYVQVEKEIIIIVITEVESAPAPHIQCQP
jgi:hypothetical protein